METVQILVNQSTLFPPSRYVYFEMFHLNLSDIRDATVDFEKRFHGFLIVCVRLVDEDFGEKSLNFTFARNLGSMTIFQFRISQGKCTGMQLSFDMFCE